MIVLKGQEGYYSRIVTIEGTEFRIRELDDDELGLFLRLVQEAGKVAGVPDLSPDDIADGGAMEQLLRSLTPDQQVAALRAQRDALDHVLTMGIVSWTIAGVECTPQARTTLPPRCKVPLARAIIADTILSEDEEAFLPQ